MKQSRTKSQIVTESVYAQIKSVDFVSSFHLASFDPIFVVVVVVCILLSLVLFQFE